MWMDMVWMFYIQLSLSSIWYLSFMENSKTYSTSGSFIYSCYWYYFISLRNYRIDCKYIGHTVWLKCGEDHLIHFPKGYPFKYEKVVYSWVSTAGHINIGMRPWISCWVSQQFPFWLIVRLWIRNKVKIILFKNGKPSYSPLYLEVDYFER